MRGLWFGGGSSVVELALARLVDEAALVLRPARTALAGAVLPLHHLGAQRVALGPLPGPLQPPRLACLLQQRGPCRQGGGGVAQGPGLAAGGRQLPAGTQQGWVRARAGAARSLPSAGCPVPSFRASLETPPQRRPLYQVSRTPGKAGLPLFGRLPAVPASGSPQPPTSPAPSLGAPPPGPRPGPPSLLELRPLARSPAPSLVPASGHEATPLRAPPLRRRAGSLPGELAPQAPAPDLPNPPLRVSRPRPRPAHPSLRSPSGRAASGCGEGGPGSSTMVLPVT